MRTVQPALLASENVCSCGLTSEIQFGEILFQDLEKGKYATTDQYVAHVVLAKDCKGVLLITSKSVQQILVKTCHQFLRICL